MSLLTADATLRDAYGSSQFGLSFELFPPKTEAGERALARHVARLVEFGPSFMTCTYGAGGSTRGKTLDIIAQVHADYGLPVATHLTCVGHTADELRAYLQEANDRGVHNVVALRGDPPHGESEFRQTDGGFRYANELVAMIRSDFPEMGIAVGGYPEVHQEAPDRRSDLENLKRKVDAGADVIITQLFYDNEDFYRFRDDCDELGVDAAIIPGLLPVTNLSQVKRITSLCGSRLPEAFSAALESAADEQEQFERGVEFAIEQTQQLMDRGVPGVHFYVLNKSEATSRVLQAVTRPA
ncbi:MAG: methylenetetrahydrofolate reductase [NAD(P)H] [Planctomycetota bacterium]